MSAIESPASPLDASLRELAREGYLIDGPVVRLRPSLALDCRPGRRNRQRPSRQCAVLPIADYINPRFRCWLLSPAPLSLRLLPQPTRAAAHKLDLNLSQTSEIIALSGVTKRYGRRTALQNVTLSVGRGVTGLLGPNGSGKSTLIKSLLGLLRLQAGTATVLGFALPRELKAIRDHVGYLPEDDCFIAGLSGIESVRFMARLSGLEAVEGMRRSHEVLDFADIGQERYRNVETYSTGMRQKLKFAQAIVHDPQLLILDEPTTGLDPEQRVSMLRKIKNLASSHGKSVLISTHILHDVRAVCEQVVIMAAGQVRLVDSLENLSRPVQRGMLVELEALRPATVDSSYPDTQLLADALQRRGLACDIRRDGTLWVAGLVEGECRLVWEAAKNSGVHIRQLSSAKNSLEEVFFQAVQEMQHAVA